MDTLHAPWREQYVDETHKPKKTCIFCENTKEDDDQNNLILGRYEYNFIVMNKYPYNAGHLLVIPFEHIDSIEQLNTEASNEMMRLIKSSTEILRKELKNNGTNIGINMGKASGAGIPGHLHTHILPRWLGDTNFLPVLAGAKQVSSDITKMYKRLKPLFDKI
jgi:ATP adenylyltransferase